MHVRHLKWSSKHKKLFCQFQITITQQVHMIKLIQLLICVPNVVYYCKWFSISVLINPFCDSGTAKYRPQMVLLIFLCSFQYASRKNYSSDIRFFPQPLITITIARCPANFINLSAIIVDLWLSEYCNKLRHDSQIAVLYTGISFFICHCVTVLLWKLYSFTFSYISRVDKQRCITTSFVESAFLISKFVEFCALSCWQKCIQRTLALVE